MTPENRRLIADTWQQVLPIADAAMPMFYDRLFQLDPELRDLFAGVEMNRQGAKLAAALNTLVDSIEDLSSVMPELRDLGRRHAAYGVTDEHYGTVGAALLWTLRTGLGDSWSKAVEDAWAEAYGVATGLMKEGAAESVTIHERQSPN